MKLYLRHRVNHSEELKFLAPEWGAEIDVRSAPQERLQLSHDPWQEGEDLEHWLRAFKVARLRGPLAINTKEDGLEDRILRLLERYEIPDAFFVDTPAPTLIKWTQQKGKRCFAVRVSQYESAAAATAFRGKADWIWLDSFDGTPAVQPDVLRALGKDFKICLVSPELHGRPECVEDFKVLQEFSHAVCVKDPQRWVRF